MHVQMWQRVEFESKLTILSKVMSATKGELGELIFLGEFTNCMTTKLGIHRVKWRNASF